MILNYGKKHMAMIIGGSATDLPNYMMIGSGSGTVASTQTEMINPWDRQAITSADCSTAYKVKFTTDWTSAEVSGLQLKEFGMIGSAAGTTGSQWERTTMLNVIFNGTQELRIESNWEYY